MPNPKYLLVVNHIVRGVFQSVDTIKKLPGYEDLQVLLITKNRDLATKYRTYIEPRFVIDCDFENDEDIKEALQPYVDNIVGVICRGDKHIQYLRKVVPFLPKEVLAATPNALKAATDKRLMRETFIKKYPEITPKFIEVHGSSKAVIDQIELKLGYPVIIKPANLFSSLLIHSCSNRAELEAGLEETFAQLDGVYSREDINGTPSILVEEFLEGDFYSTDVFVLQGGNLFYTPLVGYIPAKQLGIDDFFLYKRFIPTDLSLQDIDAAFMVTGKALEAVALEYSAAHVELIKTAKGWKIIELGPRLGRFRNIMYKRAYGIDLSLNDLKIHLGFEPEIKDRLIKFCAAYSIYPLREGKLKSIKNLEYLADNEAVAYMNVNAKPGQYCYFAKNGGHALAEFIVTTSDKAQYQKMTGYIENNIYAEID